MSDQDLGELLQQMAHWLEAEPFEPGSEFLGLWLEDWARALPTAERGPRWPDLVAQAHALGARVQARTGPLLAQRDTLLAELSLQGRGQRALRGYQTGTRGV